MAGSLTPGSRYDHANGRFTQEDPLGLAGGLNLYGFANGDPVNFSDPFGLCPPKDSNRLDCTVHLNGATLSDPKFRARLEHLATHTLGRNIELNGPRSGDRTADQNESLQTVTTSPHLENQAADFHVEGMSNTDVARAAEGSGLFKGVELSFGVEGIPGRGPHVHVDIHGTRRHSWTEFRDGSTINGLPVAPIVVDH